MHPMATPVGLRLASVLLALGGLSALGVAGQTSAFAATLSPPVIRESFTRLPCPAKPQTTLAMEGCLEQRVIRGDHAIDGVARVIFTKLPNDSARSRFIAAQTAWLAFRRADCRSVSDVNEGGSLAGIDYLTCSVSRNTQRLADLRSFRAALTHP